MFRWKWPTGPLVGRFSVLESVVTATESSLVQQKGPDGPHEGMVFWGGRESPGQTSYLAAATPETESGWGHVRANESQVSAVVQAFRRAGLGLLAQVHSHPGRDARHSIGDDEMIFMPFEGMVSIVVPLYGRTGMRPLSKCGIHQYRGDRWVLCTTKLERLSIVPDGASPDGSL